MFIPTLPISYTDFITVTPILLKNQLNTADRATLSSAHTFVDKIQPSYILGTGNYIRLVVQGPATGGTSATLTNTYIGSAALTGRAWDFAASPTRVTWAEGNNSITLQAGETQISDSIPFALLDVTTVIAFDVASGSTVPRVSGRAPNIITYFKASTTEAGTAAKSGTYTAQDGCSFLLDHIEAGN